MKNIIVTLAIFSLFIACEKETEDKPFFTPTDHHMSTQGSDYRLIVRTDSYGFLIASKAEGIGFCWDSDFLLVKPEQLEEVSIMLSDTLKFKWQIRPTVSPFPETDCVISISNYGYERPNDLMCSIGNNAHTDEILSELSNAFEGEAKLAFDELIAALRETR